MKYILHDIGVFLLWDSGLSGEVKQEDFMRAEMGGGPASYIPAHTSSALAASFRT